MSGESMRRTTVLLLAPIVLTLGACGAGGDLPEAAGGAPTAGRLVFAIRSAQTGTDGRRCVLDVTARNDTGAAALNVQVAWMAQTEGFGIISDYQILGDFAAAESRAVQLGVVGAPCNAVREMTLTRAVCVVGPAQDPPQSCADLVVLDGGGIVDAR